MTKTELIQNAEREIESEYNRYILRLGYFPKLLKDKLQHDLIKRLNEILSKYAGKRIFLYTWKNVFKRERQGIAEDKLSNIKRVVRTEIQIMYNKNLNEEWAKDPTIIGRRIRLSRTGKNHCEICKNMAGVYPLSFEWSIWHPNCYSEDTSVMTNHGWKLFKDLKGDELIYSLNPENNTTEYVPFNVYIEKDFKGEMINFKNNALDMLVTPDHPMKYISKSGYWSEKKAIDFTQNNGAIYRAQEYYAEDVKDIKIGKYTIDFDLFCEFMAYYLADGSVARTRNKQIAISQFHNKSKSPSEKIEKCLEKMPFSVSKVDSGWYIFDQCFYDYLKPFGHAHEKRVPVEILNASKRQINIFLNAYVITDGHHRKREKTFINSKGVLTTLKTDQRQFFTTSEIMFKDLCELILKAGKRPSYSIDEPKEVKHHNGTYTAKNKLYRINELNGLKSTQFNKEFVPYDGKVYDVQLVNNHIMYVSRNGKPFWGSNCMCEQFPVYGKPGQVIKMPKRAIRFVGLNRSRFENWKTQPYWLEYFK